MENIEKFIKLLHGGLDEESERSLFAELAIDGDMRADFKSFASITDSIKENTDTFAPSSAVKNRIFAKAGFAMPAEPVIQVDSAVNKGAFLKGKIFTSLMAGIGSTILTILLMQLFFMPGSESASNNLSEGPSPAIAIETLKSESQGTEQGMGGANDRPIIKYIYVKQNNEIGRQESLSRMNRASLDNKINRPIALSQPDLYNKTPINNLRLHNSNFLSTPEYVYERNFIQSLQTTGRQEKEIGLSFEARGTSNWNFPSETVSPDSYSRFNNMDLAVFYELSDYFKAGGGIRWETYYTEYIGTEADGSKYKYRQRPNFMTYSAALRYFPFDIYPFTPFVQLGAGVNRGGYVARPALGVEYHAYPDLSFMLGIEYNHFWFSHQNNWFTTSKAGVYYGISYQF